MNIIKSDIISAENDVFWNDISTAINDAEPRPVLVLVTSYEKGGVEETQLLKMIDACKLTPDQYTIVQLEQEQQIAWHQLAARLNPEIVFLIGIKPIQLGISALFCLNEPNRFNDKVWLPTLSIRELEQHKEVKKQLWVNGINPVFINRNH
jgi:hypothetical protein